MEKYYRKCSGPNLEPDAEKCGSEDADRIGWHLVPPTGDTAIYNGVRNWRCPECNGKYLATLRGLRDSQVKRRRRHKSSHD